MDSSTPALKMALRVLGALSDHRNPPVMDVERLRKFAPPHLRSLPTDKMAYEIVQEALKRHTQAPGKNKRRGPS